MPMCPFMSLSKTIMMLQAVIRKRRCKSMPYVVGWVRSTCSRQECSTVLQRNEPRNDDLAVIGREKDRDKMPLAATEDQRPETRSAPLRDENDNRAHG